MPGWTKRFLKVRKEEKSTTDDPQEVSFNNAMRLLEQLKQPTEADLAKICFYYFKEGSSDAFWLEGKIAKRVTKSSHAKKSKYMVNWYNLDQLRPIINFGSGTYPSEKVFQLNAKEVTETGNIKPSEEEQHVQGQTAGQAMTDGASAIARPQHDEITNLPAYQINGTMNPPAYQNYGTKKSSALSKLDPTCDHGNGLDHT